jgi:hypothetical protein
LNHAIIYLSDFDVVVVLDIAVVVVVAAALVQTVAVHVEEVYGRQGPFPLGSIQVLLAFHAMCNGQSLHRSIFRGLAGRGPKIGIGFWF